VQELKTAKVILQEVKIYLNVNCLVNEFNFQFMSSFMNQAKC